MYSVFILKIIVIIEYKTKVITKTAKAAKNLKKLKLF